MENHEDVHFETLEVFSTQFQAEVVKLKLESMGIYAHILDNNVNFSFGPTNVEGFRLQVRREDFEKALNIYKNSL